MTGWQQLMMRNVVGVVMVCGVCFVGGIEVLGERPLSYEGGARPDDVRLKELTNLNDYFPFVPPKSAEVWKVEREKYLRQVMVANGLWPMPEKTALNAVVHGKVERDDYTVERVYFESFPGHYVTGSLYKPKNLKGKHPVVLSPHGHWSNGRFYANSEGGVKNEIKIGAERFMVGGRYPLQARCVQLARMGCVVFHYDMEGYADSVQIDHRPGYRKEMSKDDKWGFFSPQADLRLQTLMGLQTWNSIRAVDFVTSLDFVDGNRIAVTGGSGGGTQSMLLAAVDDRVAVSIPAVMVSTAMQGGCMCENTHYLRIGGGNVHLAALFAPKPQWLTAADDWTIELEEKGLPELKQLYALMGKKEHMGASLYTQFKHNYNAFNRRDMYAWVNRHFKLGHAEPIIERDYKPLSREELTVWGEGHPKPSGEQVGDAHEWALMKTMWGDTQKQMKALEGNREKYEEVVGGAWASLIGRTFGETGEVKHSLSKKVSVGDYLVMSGVLSVDAHGEEIPVVSVYPKTWNKQVVVWLTQDGKQGVLEKDGRPIAQVAQLVAQGYTVVGVDLLMQGEFVNGMNSVQKARMVGQGQGNRQVKEAVYTYCYNYPLVVKRAHDLLSVIRFVKDDEHQAEKIHVVGGDGEVSPVVGLAMSQVPAGVVNRVGLRVEGFKFADLKAHDDVRFLPGAVKYGGMKALLGMMKVEGVKEGNSDDDLMKFVMGE